MDTTEVQGRRCATKNTKACEIIRAFAEVFSIVHPKGKVLIVTVPGSHSLTPGSGLLSEDSIEATSLAEISKSWHTERWGDPHRSRKRDHHTHRSTHMVINVAVMSRKWENCQKHHASVWGFSTLNTNHILIFTIVRTFRKYKLSCWTFLWRLFYLHQWWCDVFGHHCQQGNIISIMASTKDGYDFTLCSFFVCQDRKMEKTIGPIFVKLSGRLRHGPKKPQLHVGLDPSNLTD